jgi:hypothetical protein
VQLCGSNDQLLCWGVRSLLSPPSSIVSIEVINSTAADETHSDHGQDRLVLLLRRPAVPAAAVTTTPPNNCCHPHPLLMLMPPAASVMATGQHTRQLHSWHASSLLGRMIHPEVHEPTRRPLGSFGLSSLPLLVAGCVGHEREEGQGGTTSSQQGCEEPGPTVVLDNVRQRDACEHETSAHVTQQQGISNSSSGGKSSSDCRQRTACDYLCTACCPACNWRHA